MESDMEKVARAICAANGCPVDMWQDWVIDARAAMAATLELTAAALGYKAFALAQAAQTDGQHNLAAGWADAANWLAQRAQEIEHGK